jgi:hypothetical protein
VQLSADHDPGVGGTVSDHVRSRGSSNPVPHARITDLERRHDALRRPEDVGDGDPGSGQSSTHDEGHLAVDHRLDESGCLDRRVFRIEAAVQELAVDRLVHPEELLLGATRERDLLPDDARAAADLLRDDRALYLVRLFHRHAGKLHRRQLDRRAGDLGRDETIRQGVGVQGGHGNDSLLVGRPAAASGT